MICAIGSSYCQSITEPKLSLTYVSPSEVGVDSVKLYEGINEIIQKSLDSMAFPGCQILLARDNQVFFHQSYGYHTYETSQAVGNDDIYDLASVTKVMASTLALMKLYEDGYLDLDKTLGDYFAFLRNSDKARLSLRKVLAHQSRLRSWIPYYKESQRKNGKYKWRTIAEDSSRSYPYRIPGSDLFLHKDFFEKRLLKMIRKSDLYEEEAYVYSGLSFYLFPMLVEQLSGQKFEEYLKTNFYEPIGATTMCFEPLKYYHKDRIVPTELDSFFRMKQIHGTVHDEGAAVMLGVSGNAGLFSNSFDLAKVAQMLQNYGVYGDMRYLEESTVKEFTRYQYAQLDNRRGLGFDKPLLEYQPEKSSVARLASPLSFGHSGYTGTLVWADPGTGILFIFLSNRVYPTRENRKLYQLNVRPSIHDLVYGLVYEGIE